jgi:NAD+ synthase
MAETLKEALKLALAQVNPHVGDIAGNVERILAAHRRAAKDGADLVVFTELAVEGYTPEDMVLKGAFESAVREGLDRLAAATRNGPAMIVGASGAGEGGHYNAVFLLEGGRVAERREKHELPNYGVFDEKRLFRPGGLPDPMIFRGVSLGVMVCEDMWEKAVTAHLAEKGAEILIVINGSPYELGKQETRLRHARERVEESGLPLLYVNQVGGQDETVFDGASFVLGGDGVLALQLPPWEEALVVSEWRRGDDGRWTPLPGRIEPYAEGLEPIYRAMVMGLRDYVNKNRFPGVVIGLSGGIDSALSAAVAVDALGAERVRCVMMPSRFTSRESLDDAAECARLLGVRYDIVPIGAPVAAFDEALKPIFGNQPPDSTEENIQARTRGLILMAISNKFGPMVLTTGNKSEMSVGYATLYGDMCGGYSVLKDVYKTTVTRLSVWRNAHRPKDAQGPDGPVMPRNVIEKPPTAELRPDQTDEASLMPYEHLDDILHCLIEEEMGFEAIVARGHAPADVKRVENLLYIAEYKRRQAPPGVKITSRNFGRDRRYPITNGFRDAR